MIAISVVIPTMNRREALAETLGALARQAMAGQSWEAIVVDNGSTDDTVAWARAQIDGFPVPLRVFEERVPGPAAARNTGARNAAGDVVVFVGDDMMPADDDLVAGHLRLHRARPEAAYIVLGTATWRPDRPITPLMHWLEHGGTQFQFDRIEAGPVDVRYFYTPNVSLKRALWERTGGFDERFPFAAVEDTEFALRLGAAGAVLDYHPELVVLHDHPTTLDASVRRMERVGRSAALFARLHPDVSGDGMPAAPVGLKWRLIRLAAAPAGPLSRARIPLAIRRRAWEVRHMAAYADGFALGPP